jgi:SulP family sulfate permease
MNNRWVPPTLRGYRPSWLSADALAGLTLVAVALPSQMATARLANLPAVAGLYAFIAGSLVYALVGKSAQLSVGADSTIAPVLAAGVASVAVIGSARYSELMAFCALAVGAVLVVVGICRLGWISEFLSTPVITGLLAGIAVEIAIRQIPIILGVVGRGHSTVSLLRGLPGQIANTNVWSLCIALGVLAVIALGEALDHRLPGALVGLVLSIVAVDAFALATHHGVVVLGTVHGGLPSVRLPTASWSAARHLVQTVFTVAFVCVAQSAATVRASSSGAPAANDFNRDLIGVGAGSVLAGLFGVFAVDASPPNTAIVTASGGRTQLANLLAAGIVLIVVVVATAPLAHLPEATLGATLLFIATKLFRVRQLRTILHFDRVEFGLAAATLIVVAVVGIEQGVALAVILSLADRTRRSARPRDTLLGREPGSDHWIPIDIDRPTEQMPGVLVYLVYAPLWYGNADYLQLRIRHLVAEAASPVRVVILDADGMSDIDYTGMQALRALAVEFEQQGVAVGIARASHLVHHDLKHGSVLAQVGGDHLFTSIEEAVEALKPRPGSTATDT